MLSFALYLKHIGNRAAFLKHFRNRVAFLNQFWSILEAFLKRKCLVFPVVRIRVAVQDIEKCAVKRSWLSFQWKTAGAIRKRICIFICNRIQPQGWHNVILLFVGMFKFKKKNYSKSHCCWKLQFKSWFNNTKLARQDIFNLFAGQKAVSFTISVCNPIFLIAKIKHNQFPDYSFCCSFVGIFVGIFKSKKKNCLKS